MRVKGGQGGCALGSCSWEPVGALQDSLPSLSLWEGQPGTAKGVPVGDGSQRGRVASACQVVRGHHLLSSDFQMSPEGDGHVARATQLVWQCLQPEAAKDTLAVDQLTLCLGLSPRVLERTCVI